MPTNDWDSDVYSDNVAFVPALGGDALALLDAAPGERVLDLGCGEGALTVQLAERAVEVVGLDKSEQMVSAAVARGIDAYVADAGELPELLRSGELTLGTFDAVFSNAALHWIPESQIPGLLSGVRQLLRPGGRFVGEFGGHGNIATIGTALNGALMTTGYARVGNPFYFPTPEQFGSQLVDAGFAVSTMELFSRPTPLTTGLRGWIAAFGTPFLETLAEDSREQVIATAEGLAADWLRDAQGNWTADYVRLRFAARLDGRC